MLYGQVGNAAINKRIRTINRRKRIVFPIESHSAHAPVVISRYQGLGEVWIFTSVFSFLVSMAGDGFITVVLLSFFSAGGLTVVCFARKPQTAQGR